MYSIFRFVAIIYNKSKKRKENCDRKNNKKVQTYYRLVLEFGARSEHKTKSKTLYFLDRAKQTREHTHTYQSIHTHNISS